MEKTLEFFGFKRTIETDTIGYSKVFKGCILFVASAEGLDKWFACLTIGKVSVNIPKDVDSEWISEFMKDNVDIL